MGMTRIQARPSGRTMSHRRKVIDKGRLKRWVARGVLALVGVLFLIPFYWLVATSLKTSDQLSVFPPAWIPNPPRWSNYVDAVTEVPFFLYLRNTLIIAGANIVGVTLSSSIVAYGFSRIAWPGRNVLFLIMLSTLMLPYQATMIPLFILFSKVFHWVNTFLPLTVPAFFGDAFSIFLLRQFFMSIPRELSEAAVIDGANEWRIFTSIVLPLARPALATVALTVFMASWTDFLNPLIYLNDSGLFTLALGLNAFLGAHASQYQLFDAYAVLISLPPLALFFFAQRTFIQGIALSGIKG